MLLVGGARRAGELPYAPPTTGVDHARSQRGYLSGDSVALAAHLPVRLHP